MRRCFSTRLAGMAVVVTHTPGVCSLTASAYAAGMAMIATRMAGFRSAGPGCLHMPCVPIFIATPVLYQHALDFSVLVVIAVHLVLSVGAAPDSPKSQNDCSRSQGNCHHSSRPGSRGHHGVALRGLGS